jgi:general secretion pathway protein J
MRGRSASGFTLIELLVAISLMALMAALAWRGLDGMTRAQNQMRQQADDVLALQAGLVQWGADLDALAVQPNTSSLDWDGRALRLLRHDPAGAAQGLRVVAWTRRGAASDGVWLRWQSPPFSTHGALQQAWQKAAFWAQNASDEDRQREVKIAQLARWQVFFYRGDTWTNPLSSEGSATGGVPVAPIPGSAAGAGAAAVPALPDGVRLVLALSPGQAISGTLTRDWMRADLGDSK